jgi:hypothetical protein
MSSESTRGLIVVLLLAAAVGGAIALFFALFEPSWEPVGSNSDAASKNPMLGAERLLQKRGYQVKVDQTLSMALFQPLPEGTLILSEGGDSMLATQAQSLLAWVERGNTLIVTPGWQRRIFNFSDKPRARSPGPAKPRPPVRDKAAEEAKDAITAHFGVALGPAAEAGSICRQISSANSEAQAKIEVAAKRHFNYVDCVASVTLPGVAHPLRLDASAGRLVDAADKGGNGKQENASPQGALGGDADEDEDDDDKDAKPDAKPDAPGDASPDAQPETPADTPAGDSVGNTKSGLPPPLIADDEAKALRVYPHGKGRVVIIAENYFNNYRLPAYDHGELLLGLTALNARGKNVTLIQRVDIASWFDIVWHAAPYAICTLAAFLLLWAWSSMRRFGPQLPEPEDRRRALLEHVDASGRWLWKSTKGRETMLAAMRRATERTLARRIPELRKMPQERQIERLAADGKMSRADLERALQDAPGRLPIEFTRQIQSLQELRAYYER